MMASNRTKEAAMNDFTITEDFPNSEIEFDQRFSNIDACYEYLARTIWPNGFICEKCGNIFTLIIHGYYNVGVIVFWIPFSISPFFSFYPYFLVW